MLSKKIIIDAFKELDKRLSKKMNLLLAGGSALLAQGINIRGTKDIDAIPFKSELTIGDISKEILEVSQKLNLPKDFINDYFYSFSINLPSDYGDRLLTIYRGNKIIVYALSPVDLLIMKFMAARAKDREHIIQIIKATKPDLQFIENHLMELEKKGVHKAEEALEYFDEITSAIGH